MLETKESPNEKGLAKITHGEDSSRVSNGEGSSRTTDGEVKEAFGELDRGRGELPVVPHWHF